MNFSGETVRKNDFEVLDGKILKPFSYILSPEELEETPEFKSAKNRAFVSGVGLLSAGFFLPAIIGFFLSASCLGTDYFGERAFSIKEKLMTGRKWSLADAKEEAAKILSDESMIEELERIYSDKNEKKYTVEKSKGVSTKYDQL